jgi:competence protein ComEC
MESAPSTPLAWLQTRLLQIELWLDSERDQIALWLPVALGAGIAAWFVLPDPRSWVAVIVLGGALVLASIGLGLGRRFARSLFWAGLCVAAGCSLVWIRSNSVAAPVLSRPMIVEFSADVEHVDIQAAKEKLRLLLLPDATSGLPPVVRVTVSNDDIDHKIVSGERIHLRARIVPPPIAAIPGGYDFSRNAWFLGIGGTGSSMGPVSHLATASPVETSKRERLSAHIRAQLDGSAGGIASAFATGDRGGIDPVDEDSMRASGLTHLLSISGLHITAVIAAAMFFTLRLLALSPWLALRAPLLVISAASGAAAGIGYTLLTGAEVPTIRSCVASVLVLIGLALGREAMTLRLVATGALFVLLLWPESVVGPSFQLSFAAITTIVALHDSAWVKRWTMKRDERLFITFWRGLLSLVLTGLAVETALAPIALFHFHKSGLYGAFANIIAIPLTTFVIMPFEALALLFDVAGLGFPFWWVTGQALNFLLWLSRAVAAAPGAVATLPSVPIGAFGLMIGGGLWLMLWKHRPRLWGLFPVAIGGLWAWSMPVPDLLITGDGKHLAARSAQGDVTLLRPRTGEYMRDVLAEGSGTLAVLDDIDGMQSAQCGRDLCLFTLHDGARNWQIAATRSQYVLPWASFIDTCAAVDIIVSDRRLPMKCKPRWLKLDRQFLAKTGGLSIFLSEASVKTVRRPGDFHPWVLARP